MNFFDKLDSTIAKIFAAPSEWFHPSGGSYPNYPVVTNDEFLQLQPQKNQSALVLIGIAAFVLLIMGRK